MSISASTCVWSHSRLRGSARTLLLAIADRADEEGYAWPGVDELSKRLGLSGRQTQRLIRQASTLGEMFVRVGGGRKKSSRYLIALGLGHGELMGRLIVRFEMDSEEAARTATDLLERQKSDIHVRVSRPQKVTSASPFTAANPSPPESKTVTSASGFDAKRVTFASPLVSETLTPSPPEPSVSDLESFKDPDPIEESTFASPGRSHMNGSRLHEAYRPRPSPASGPPPSKTGEGPSVPEGLIGLYRYHLVHYARPGEQRTLCGQPVGRFEPAPMPDFEVRDACLTCKRAAGNAPAQPHIAIIHAWWESIPDTIRPPGSAPIEPNLRDARDLRDAGITPDQVREFVRATSPGYVKWARWKSKEEHKAISPVIPLSNVKKNIKAFFAPKDEPDEQDDESEKRHEPSRPPKPAGLEQIFGK